MKEIAKIIVATFLAIIYGFIVKYCGTDVAIISLLIVIQANLIIKDEV